MTNFVITPSVKAQLVELGHRRNAMKDPSWTRRKSDVFNDQQVDALGCIGEYAMSVFLGVPMDWAVHSHGDKGIDLVLQDGRTMAVKFNHRQRGYVMVEERPSDTETSLSDLSTDLIGLVHGSCQPPRECYCKDLMTNNQPWNLVLAGYLTAQEFVSRKQYANWGLGGRYFVKADSLKDITQLRRPQMDLNWIADYERTTW